MSVLLLAGLLALGGCSQDSSAVAIEDRKSADQAAIAVEGPAPERAPDLEMPDKGAPAVKQEASVSAQSKQAAVTVPQHAFVGALRCAMCHRAAKIGEQYQRWQNSAHAKAYERLASPEAHALALERGIEDPQQSSACLKCHSTAYWFSEERVSEQIAVEEGVSCESCHGPGKDYMKIGIMKDRAAALAAGLLQPDETTCLRCHNENAPNPKPFDFSSAWERIRHSIPE